MAEYRVVMKGDELYHWKYLDKYQKNGKWIYIYDEAKGRVKSAANSAKETAGRIKKKAGFKVGTIRRKTRHAVNDTKKSSIQGL